MVYYFSVLKAAVEVRSIWIVHREHFESTKKQHLVARPTQDVIGRLRLLTLVCLLTKWSRRSPLFPRPPKDAPQTTPWLSRVQRAQKTSEMSRFWQFAQLSDAYKSHSLLDQVSQSDTEGQLFIGGLKVIDRPDVLDEHGITHVLSVLEYDHCDYDEYTKYQRLRLAAEDHPSQNLVQHFEKANAFIDQALAVRGRVLVHCAMGISRSAAVVCAYLMYRYKIPFLKALGQLQEARPSCAPNTGFIQQLEVFERMLSAQSQQQKVSIYNEWLTKSKSSSKL